MAVLAIDQGTSATKALVVGDDGAVLGLAEVAVEVRATADGAVELSPDDIGADQQPHLTRQRELGGGGHEMTVFTTSRAASCTCAKCSAPRNDSA